jgi:CheY-like chemotaxis protein
MNQTEQRPILLVEDNDTHCEAMTRALRHAGCATPVVRCSDGEEALDYLFRRGRFARPADSTRPSIILLDLNLPGRGGLEVLAVVKSDSELKVIPVIIVSSLSDAREIHRCYENGASGYIRKRASFDETIEVARGLCQYWFRANEILTGVDSDSAESS